MQNNRVVANPQARQTGQLLDTPPGSSDAAYQLSSLIKKSQTYRHIEQALYQQFPNWRANGIQLACIKPQHMVLTCRDSAWASQLRMQHLQILKTCNRLELNEIKNWLPLKTLEIKILTR